MRFEHRTLLDVQLEVRSDRMSGIRGLAASCKIDPCELIAEPNAVAIPAVESRGEH
jgi:hypothetical protein